MPVCSLIRCGIRKVPNKLSLCIHRISKSNRKKKKLLEAIGIKNIKPNVKYIYICLLHFDDKCFNKTLNVTQLRDVAVPFKCEENKKKTMGNCGSKRKKNAVPEQYKRPTGKEPRESTRTS